MLPYVFSLPGTHFKGTPCYSFGKQNFIFHQLFINKKVVFIDLWNTVSHSFIFTFVQDNQKRKVFTKNKMDNPRFVDEETISVVQD